MIFLPLYAGFNWDAFIRFVVYDWRWVSIEMFAVYDWDEVVGHLLGLGL